MEIKEIRVMKLRAFVHSIGGPAAFARKFNGVDPTYISQLLNGHRGFGEKAARKLERQTGKPEFYFDRLDDGHIDTRPNVISRPDGYVVDPISLGGRGHPDFLVNVPLIQTTQRGQGMERHEFSDVQVPRSWLERWGVEHANALFVAVWDDAMAPEIRSGGQCIADRSRTEIEPGERYVIEIGGRTMIRRLHVKLDGSIRIVADAGGVQWPEETVQPDQLSLINVLARILWIFNKA